jgi:glycosyltransferase involved in cell wall biosynthesis
MKTVSQHRERVEYTQAGTDFEVREETQLQIPARFPETSVAVLIPCFNEAAAITETIAAFKRELPGALIYVYDNNSRDDTAALAAAAGAIVRHEPLQGKGHVVRRMFSDIEADIYVLVDGDGTYDASSASKMVELLEQNHLDLVNGVRVTDCKGAYRPGHRFGNTLLTGLVASLFGNRFQDLLSGYKVFSRRFIKSFPALSTGFEIETELAVHALELRMPVAERPTVYKERQQGSVSKLNTWRDGLRILRMIVLFLKEKRPLYFFSMIGLAMATLAVLLAVPLLDTYLRTGLVPRFPTAILSTGLMILAFLSFVAGVILDTVTRAHLATKRLIYLNTR